MDDEARGEVVCGRHRRDQPISRGQALWLAVMAASVGRRAVRHARARSQGERHGQGGGGANGPLIAVASTSRLGLACLYRQPRRASSQTYESLSLPRAARCVWRRAGQESRAGWDRGHRQFKSYCFRYLKRTTRRQVAVAAVRSRPPARRPQQRMASRTSSGTPQRGRRSRVTRHGRGTACDRPAAPPLPLSRAAPQKSPHLLPSPASARSAVAINSLRMRAARRRAFAHRSSVCVSIFLKASLRVLLRSRLRGLLWRFFPTVPLLFEPLRSPVCDAWARGITMRTHAGRRDGARGISPLPPPT